MSIYSKRKVERQGLFMTVLFLFIYQIQRLHIEKKNEKQSSNQNTDKYTVICQLLTTIRWKSVLYEKRILSNDINWKLSPPSAVDVLRYDPRSQKLSVCGQ